MVEIEGKGVDYERYALGRLFRSMVENCRISSILEIPAKGEKAMPSLYSIAFGEAGCEVTLVNAEEKSKPAWNELGVDVSYRECPDLGHTDLEGDTYDLVWNFHYLARHPTPDNLVAEMARLSKSYVLYVGVNRYNPGFYSHRLVHRLCKVPWNHGDVDFMDPFYVSSFLENTGLRIVKTGTVDAPPFPDSIGIRDMRLHRKNLDLSGIAWKSRTIEWMKKGKYPRRMGFYYLFEKLPLPFRIKLLQAHLFYVLAQKESDGRGLTTQLELAGGRRAGCATP